MRDGDGDGEDFVRMRRLLWQEHSHNPAESRWEERDEEICDLESRSGSQGASTVLLEGTEYSRNDSRLASQARAF